MAKDINDTDKYSVTTCFAQELVRKTKEALAGKADAEDLTQITLDSAYDANNQRIVFSNIVFDNIYPAAGKYGLAVFPEDTAVAATQFAGDSEWLLDWRPYLVDMKAYAGEAAKHPVAELQKDNWLRKTDGAYAPVCCIKATQASALDGKKDTLYWKTGSAGDKVSATVPAAFDTSGNFVPSAFWEYVKGNLPTVNTKAGVTYAAPIEVKVYVASQAYSYGAITDYHIPAPWETTDADLSVFIGRAADVYLVDGYSATTGEHMRGLTSKPLPVGTNKFDPEDYRLRRTGISPGPSTVVSSKIRNLFYNYVNANSTGAYVQGNAGTLSILYNNGTYPATNGPHQYRAAEWSRGCNSTVSAPYPVAELGYHALNAFMCSLEAAYGTRDVFGSATKFSTGNSSNDACASAANYRTNGGFRCKVGSGTEFYARYNTNIKSNIGASSDAYVYNVVNGQYAHFQCMEPQVAASLFTEMGIGASTGSGNNEFSWNGGTWHYEVPSIAGIATLGSGAMNCRIYKEVTFSGKTIAGIASCSGGTMLRCALAEGVNPVGDIWWYAGGGAELVYESTGTSSDTYKYSFYLEPDQTKWYWYGTSDTSKEYHSDNSLFPTESLYAKLVDGSTAGSLGNAYVQTRWGYTPVRRTNGGSSTTGECCYQYRTYGEGSPTASGQRTRRRLLFRCRAGSDTCSPRSLAANYRPSDASVGFGCAAQCLLA